MTPKEKAEELFNKFHLEVLDRDGTSAMNGFEAKQCALIAVDEIINNFGLFSEGKKHYCSYNTIEYYEQVKIEIQNL